MQQISVGSPIKTRAMQLVERRIGRPLDEFLRERYDIDQKTTTEIAQELGVNDGTVSRWMALLGIETRLTGPRKSVA
jgi:transposase-like protein